MLEVMSHLLSSEFLNPSPSGPLALSGAQWGVVLLHGFTAGPSSVLPWGEALASAGAAVSIPLLPGHGTQVSDLAQTRAGAWRRHVQQLLDHLLDQDYDRIAVGGLSLGGALALDAAAHRAINAIFVVNPALSFKPLDKLGASLSPLLQGLIPTVGPLAGDIKKPGVIEVAYNRTPVPAVEELAKLFRTVRRQLGAVKSPVTLYQSTVDHIVPASSARILHRRLDPGILRTVLLENSYHVATLDYDAPTIHQDSIATLLGHSGTPHVQN